MVDKFRYLGDVIEAGGGSEGALLARVRSGWAKWRQLAPFLAARCADVGEEEAV